MPKNVWEVLRYMSSLLVHASDLWPYLLNVKIVISYMADARKLCGLIIIAFHFYSMCTYCYGVNNLWLIQEFKCTVVITSMGQVDISFAGLEGKGLSAVLRDCHVYTRHILIMSGG